MTVCNPVRGEDTPQGVRVVCKTHDSPWSDAGRCLRAVGREPTAIEAMVGIDPNDPLDQLAAEVVRLHRRLARMTEVARDRGEQVAFADAHLPQWEAIRDERDDLRAELDRLTESEAALTYQNRILDARWQTFRDQKRAAESERDEARALRDAADTLDPFVEGETEFTNGHARWLRERADRIEGL